MVLPGFSLLKTVVLGFSLAALAAGLWVVYGGGGDTRYRSRAVVGLLLALAGVIGVWGIAFFSFELVRLVLTQKFQAEGLSGAQLAGKLTYWTGITSMIQNLGAFFGVYGFGLLSQRVGRKPAFAVSFVLAMTSVASTFWFLRDFSDLWLVPLMGFGTLSVNGGWRLGERMTLAAGIDNLFDRDYSEHLNLAGNSAFGYPAEPVRIHEPGRTVWIKLGASF